MTADRENSAPPPEWAAAADLLGPHLRRWIADRHPDGATVKDHTVGQVDAAMAQLAGAVEKRKQALQAS